MTMNKDALLIDLRRVRLDMQGISPKVSTYAKLKAREAELLKQIGKDPGKALIKAFTPEKRAKLFKKPEAPEPARTTERLCVWPGCKNLGKVYGKKNENGVSRRKAECKTHYTRRQKAKKSPYTPKFPALHEN